MAVGLGLADPPKTNYGSAHLSVSPYSCLTVTRKAFALSMVCAVTLALAR
jgi:hypothetical protein